MRAAKGIAYDVLGSGLIIWIVPITLIWLFVPAWSAGTYDGTCHGRLEASGNNATNCAKSAPVQITVTDNKLEYHHFSNAAILALVGPRRIA
jgi:hypothetical protein